MDFTWSSLSSFLMRIEITWSKVESTTFLLLRNALDLFRNLLDRCFIEITLSKVKSISFFWKMFLKIRHVWWQAWIKHHGYLSQEFICYLWHFESRYLIENLLKILLDLDLRKTEMSMGSRAKNKTELGQRMNSMEHGASFQIMGNTFIKK